MIFIKESDDFMQEGENTVVHLSNIDDILGGDDENDENDENTTDTVDTTVPAPTQVVCDSSQFINSRVLMKICGEMVNIEQGRREYTNGISCISNGAKNEYSTDTHTYTFYPTSGVIYVPCWPSSQIKKWVVALTEILTQYPTQHLSKATAATLIHPHTAHITRMSGKRSFVITNTQHHTIPDTRNFVWVIKPMYTMFECEITKNTVIHDFASIVYDKFDVWDITDGGVIIAPTMRHLRVATNTASLGKVIITHFKHTNYYCPFFHYYNVGCIIHREDLFELSEIPFPEKSVYNPPSQIDKRLNLCNSCGNPTWDLTYLGLVRTKYKAWCPACVHSNADVGENIKYITKSPNKLDDVMNAMNIPKYQQEIYRTMTKCESIVIGRVTSGVQLYDLDNSLIAVNATEFKDFITTPRAVKLTEHGKLVNAHVIIVE